MKGEISIAWLVVAVVIVAGIGGYYFTNGFTKFSGTIDSVSGCKSPTDSSGMLLVPLMGYYECAPAIGGQIADSVVIDDSQNRYYNLCTINTPSCQITYNGNGGTLTFCDKSEVVKNFLGQDSCSVSRTFQSQITINSNAQFSTIFIPQSNFLGAVKATLQRTYTPFTLWQTTPTGGRNQVYQTSAAQCSPPGSAKLCSGDTTSQYCTKGVYHGALTYYETSNYFDKLVIGPVKGNTYTYNGQTVYGAGDGTLYSIGKVSFNDGTCYSVPQSVIAHVACLPGAVTGGQQCGTDFAWHTLPSSTGSSSVAPACIGDFQCPGQGNYVVDFSDAQRKTAVKYSCQSGQCILASKVTSTCSDSVACPTGTTCFLSPSSGIGSCLATGTNPSPGRTTGILCPDGITTVTDAKLCPLIKTNGLPWSVIFAIIGGILTFLVAGAKAIKDREGSGIAIAGVVAVIAAIVIWWFVENIILILAGSIILTILGGLALYFFGGIIITVFLVVGVVVDKIREMFE